MLFDLKVANTWTLLDAGDSDKKDTAVNRPQARSFHTMASLNHKLYVFGGCSVDHGRLSDLYEFDLLTSKWTKINDGEGIVQRGGSSLCALNGGAESDESVKGCLILTGGFCGHELDECHR